MFLDAVQVSFAAARFIKPYQNPVYKYTLHFGKVLLNGRYQSFLR